jgi:hypothetical protein
MTFAEAFVSLGLTEFFLYFGWVIKCDGGMATKYEIHERISPVIWEHQVSLAAVRKELARGAGGQSPFLSVHRRAFSKMRSDAIKHLALLWAENDLFNSQREAEAFIRHYRRGVFLPFMRETLRRKIVKRRARLKLAAAA